MAKKEKVRLEDLTHEELLKKCYNQKRVIQELNGKISDLNKKNRLLETVMGNASLNHKLLLCMQETMSYIDDVDNLKNEIKKLKGEL